MGRVSRQTFGKYIVAVAAVAVAFILKLAINQLVRVEAPFLFFFAAVAISTWYGGFGPGLLAAFLSAIAAAPFFTIGVFRYSAAAVDLFQLVLFFLEALLIVGLTGSLREVRVRTQTTASAREAADALLDTFQVYAPIGLAFLDNNLRYVRINYAMAELNGLTPAAHIGRTINEVQPQIEPEMIASIRQVIETGKPLLDRELTVNKVTMLGLKKQHLLTSYYRVRSADGKSLGVGAVMVDITAIKQAEVALRESEQRFRTLADTAPVLIWMADTSKLCTYINKVWTDFTGRALDQVLGSGWTEDLHPDDLDSALASYRTAFDAREEFKSEFRLRRSDGEYRWMVNHGIPRYTPDGEFIGYIGSCMDIDERKQIETNQQFLAEASIILASSLDYETTLTNVAQLAVPEIGDWCAVDLLTPEGTVKRLAVAHVDPEKVNWAYELSARYPVDLNAPTGVGHVIRTGESQFVPLIDEAMLKAAAETPEMYAISQAIGFTSLISVPLRVRDRILGALTLVSAESGQHYTERDLKLAEALATRAALAVDNARLYNQARAERERFRVTLASIGDAVIATDRQGQISFINHVAGELIGWQQADVMGKPLEDVFKIINEQSREIVESPVAKVLREGNVVGLANHTVLISKSGREIPIDDSGAPIPAEDGGIEGIVLVFRDVTERKRAEERQQFLYDASNLLSSSLDYEKTLQNVTQLAVPALADWCIIHLNEDGEIRQVALYHADAERAALREEMMRRYPPIASDLVSHTAVISSGKPQLLQEVSDALLQAAAVNDEHLNMLRQLQYKSSISVPLKNPDGVFGALTLRTSQGGRTLTNDDLTLSVELGHLVSLAIQNARLYRRAQNNGD